MRGERDVFFDQAVGSLGFGHGIKRVLELFDLLLVLVESSFRIIEISQTYLMKTK